MPGGVCAVLDYETDIMAEYVAEMSMRIILPNATVTGAFRKFVSQILTSTRLPSTTILLGMNYLAKRVNSLNAAGPFKPQEGEAWRMLTVALLLGSKFLDDNTFQNRSWSEVSGIPVSELNTMEHQWLDHIGWVLYVNLDRSHDFNAWLKNWKEWQETKKRQQLQQKQQQQQSQALARERLAPIVTSIRQEPARGHHPLLYEGWTPEEIAEYDRATVQAGLAGTAKGTAAYRPREGSWSSHYHNNMWSQAQAPLTPPDSGYGTPEYLDSAASVNLQYNEWFNNAVAASNYNRDYQRDYNRDYSRDYHRDYSRDYNRGYQQSAGHNTFGGSRTGSHHQPYFSSYSHNHWDSTVAECNCSHCMAALHSKPSNYFHHHSYGQPVMG
ncbi:hypothetical protein MGN70_014765 [Eutypa lata]|uniref:Putative cyclin-like protein n=1 Tax=Eutypa lata (strain UCR-EL1) TaxID=1287681 RepID=M7SUP6_EUTLA|nr:putative cyclin-like protein [Eutypa lata UCREL1]KAI1244888.1 hypothetical protein MGN70_014765 [Eutypa lata]